MNGPDQEALQNIVTRPKYLDFSGRGIGEKQMKYYKLAETLKIIANNQCRQAGRQAGTYLNFYVA